VLGHHEGQHDFTIGQRRGIGVASPEPLFVLEKHAGSGRVVVGPREALATSSVALDSALLHRPAAEVDAVKLRYRSQPLPCRVTGEGSSLRVELEEPALAAAPGQLACLLSGDRVAGHATIAEESIR
jgi:tRNA-specific 2-thiouridylase